MQSSLKVVFHSAQESACPSTHHMYGSTMGTLNVYVGQKKIFTKTGDQGNQWKQAMVNITDPGASEV